VHEDFSRRETPRGSSNREFGLVFTGLFAIVGGVQWWTQSAWWWSWLIAAAVVLFLALAWPAALAPFNRLWTKFSLLLFRIVNPIVMAILFFLVVLPTGLLMRLAGKDPMNRRFAPAAPSYWIHRDPAGPAPDTMKNQF
jgi:hypothetical protein